MSNELMDQMEVREKVPCEIGEQFAELEFGVGENDGYLYASLKYTEGEFGAVHLNLDIAIGSEDGAVHNKIPDQLRRLADAMEKNSKAIQSQP